MALTNRVLEPELEFGVQLTDLLRNPSSLGSFAGLGSVMQHIAQFVRKKDFEVKLVLQPEDTDRQSELVEAIFVVKPSLLVPKVTLEVYQPVLGDIANIIFNMCHNGVTSCSIKTLTPNQPTPTNNTRGHIEYSLSRGHVSFHENYLSRDAIEGDDFMVHTLQIDFDTMKIRTNRGHMVAKEGGNVLRLIPGGRS